MESIDEKKPETDKKHREIDFTLIGITIFWILGNSAVLLSLVQSNENLLSCSLWQRASLGLLISAAATVVGGIFGFLFGIPKTFQTLGANPNKLKADSPQIDQQSDIPAEFKANTNLEDVSDWLTKILVGVSLTQVNDLGHKLEILANAISPGFTTSTAPKVLAFGILSFFPIIGFLFGWLWTRLYLPTAMRRTEIKDLSAKVAYNTTQINKITHDEAVENLVRAWLYPAKGAPLPGEIEKDKFRRQIGSASGPMLGKLFHITREIRKATYRSGTSEAKQRSERAVTVFEALIIADKKQKYHRNHAQLAYSLMEQSKPDWQRAKEELSRAIELRNSEIGEKDQYPLYESNRAWCSIQLAIESYGSNSIPIEIKKEILDDYKVACKSASILQQLEREKDELPDWLFNEQNLERNLNRLLS